jgi:hypothetical protein
MRLAHTSLWLDEPPPTRDHSFISERGEGVACLRVGEGDLTVYGVPDAFRRLAAALVVSADAAESLIGQGTPPAATPFKEAA